jgi:hypothetical protein
MSDGANGGWLVLCRDLLFVSKITATARALGVSVTVIRDVARLSEEGLPSRMIVDLTDERFLNAASEWKQKSRGRVTGFAGHADAETIERARTAGLDEILARGEFSARLGDILQS